MARSLSARAPQYPRKRSRIVWGLLECLCFCGMTSSWDLLFPLLQRNNLLFYNGNCCPGNVTSDEKTPLCEGAATGDYKNTTLVNGSRETNAPISCSNKTLCYANCHDVIALRVLPSVTSLLICVFVVPFGIFYNRAGTLKTRLISIAMFTASTLIMAFISPEDTWMLGLSWFLLGLSSILILITNLQLANLSRTKRSILIMLYYAAKESSAVMVLLIKLTAEYASVQTSFMFLTVGMIPLLVGTIAFLPKGRIPWPVPHNHCGSANSLEQYFTKKRRRQTEKDNSEQDLEPRQSGSVLASTCIFWSQIFWLCSMLYPLKVLEELSVLHFFKQNKTFLVDRHILLGCVATVISCPLIGISLDRYSNYKNEPERRTTFICSLNCVTSLVNVLVLIIGGVAFIGVDMLNAVVLSLARGLSCLCLGVQAVAVATIFPYEYFGQLLGISIIFSELSAICCYVVVWCIENEWLTKYIILWANTCLVAVSFLHVIVKWKFRDSPHLSNFTSSSYVMETIARATLSFNGMSSLNSIEAAEEVESDHGGIG